jgi:hypothetical protein
MDNNRCGNRVEMIKDWQYPYCCIITEGNTPIRHTPCNIERCPLKIEEVSDDNKVSGYSIWKDKHNVYIDDGLGDGISIELTDLGRMIRELKKLEGC